MIRHNVTRHDDCIFQDLSRHAQLGLRQECLQVLHILPSCDLDLRTSREVGCSRVLVILNHGFDCLSQLLRHRRTLVVHFLLWSCRCLQQFDSVFLLFVAFFASCLQYILHLLFWIALRTILLLLLTYLLLSFLFLFSLVVLVALLPVVLDAEIVALWLDVVVVVRLR